MTNTTPQQLSCLQINIHALALLQNSSCNINTELKKKVCGVQLSILQTHFFLQLPHNL